MPRPKSKTPTRGKKGGGKETGAAMVCQGPGSRVNKKDALVQGLFQAVLSVSLLFLGLAMPLGCGTLANGRGWGQDATLFPGWGKVGKAALNAAISPGTWVPATGALIFQIDGWDTRVSNWASKRTPIFGSQSQAESLSDCLAHTSEAAYALTLLATPSGDNFNDWICNKIKGAMVGLACAGMSEGITRGLQEATHRRRPNKQNYLSFPSTHSCNTSTFNTLASKNINYVSIPPRAAFASQVILYLVTTSTAWARVEAKEHYPSDVLVGMALGNFIGSFMNDAFLGLGTKNFFLTCEPSKKGVAVGLHWLF
jgi:hypothetical protein